MRDFKMTKSGLLLAASLALAAATTAVVAAPMAASSTQQWTYWWESGSATTQLADCAVQVAQVQDASGILRVYRAPSDAACAQNTYGLPRAPAEMVLLKQEAVESDLPRMASNWQQRSLVALRLIEKDTFAEKSSGQMAFQLDAPSLDDDMKLFGVQDESLLVAVSEQALSTIDQHATFDTRIQRLSFQPLSRLAEEKPSKPEPKYKTPKYNSIVAKIASSSALDPARISKDLRILTGEDPQPRDPGRWHSRHSSTYGARLAGKWIKQQLEESLSSVNGSGCEFFEYSPYFAPNVVCLIPASEKMKGGEEGEVVVSAHYDSRGTFGSTTAPGGDDDGSGTAALLAIARSIGSSQLTFSSPIRLIAFSGEEQGLVGSQHYASHLSAQSTQIRLALQMDMLAYRKPGEPMQIAFPDKFVTNTATEYIWKIAEIYAPELEQGYTPACCSDHQSFWEQGFPATWVFERNGPIADPMYHNSGDVTDREGYDVEQLRSIAKVVLASVLDAAGFHM